MWGRDATRNMVSTETGLPDSFDPGKMKKRTEEVDLATTGAMRLACGSTLLATGAGYVGGTSSTPEGGAPAGVTGSLEGAEPPQARVDTPIPTSKANTTTLRRFMSRPSRKELGLDSDGQIIEPADRKDNNWQTLCCEYVK